MHYPTPARWRCTVVEVHDGETVKVLSDRGMEDESVRWIRLKDTFAPGLAQTGGTESRDFVSSWVTKHGDKSGWPFLLETFRTPESDVDVTTFSRYVGTMTSAKGASLNADVQAYLTAHAYPGGTGSQPTTTPREKP